VKELQPTVDTCNLFKEKYKEFDKNRVSALHVLEDNVILLGDILEKSRSK